MMALAPTDRLGHVLVTGGAGFIGSHVVEMLLGEGWQVTVLDNLSSGSLAHLPAAVPLWLADITSPAALRRLPEKGSIQAVVHCAGQTSVAVSMRCPQLDWAVNVWGTANVVVWAREMGVRHLVFLSSGGAIYGDSETPAREDAPARPKSFYGRHKLLAEMLVRSSGLSYAILRPANVYGPRQRYGGEGSVVTTFLHSLLRGRPLEVHGDGRQVRDFVYVDDVAAAVHLALLWPRNVTWNVATGRPTSILELASVLADLTGRPLEIHFGPPRPGDVRRSLLDPSALLATGRWGPPISLVEGLLRLLAGLPHQPPIRHARCPGCEKTQERRCTVC